MAKLTKLQRVFHYYNWKYFGSALSPDTSVKWTRAWHGETKFMGVSVDDEPPQIRLHAKWRNHSGIWRATLLHEMAHLAVANERAEHGPQWLKLMRSLVRRGAFDRIF